MTDRSGEKPTIPFTHVQHVGGAVEQESGESRAKAARHQRDKLEADLNNPHTRTSNGKPSEFATKPNVTLDKKIVPPGFEI